MTTPKTALCLLALLMSLTAWAQNHHVSAGFYAGVGAALPTASLHDNFDGCVTFAGGLTAGYQRWRLKADINYGQPSFNRMNMFGLLDSEGRDAQVNAAANASLLGLGVQMGYQVWRQRRLAITPSAGIFWSRYKWDVNDIEWSKNPDGLDVFQVTNTSSTSLSHVGWIVSLDFDIKLHERYTSGAFLGMGDQARYTSSLRLTPWVAHASYDRCTPAVKGCLIGLNVTYAGLLQAINP